MAEMVIAGRFERRDSTPVAGAAVHAVFLGDPPGNCGTTIDLERAPSHTDDSGGFRVAFSDPDRMLRPFGPAGVWRRGGFFVVGVKDGRTLGFVVASGEELVREPVRLTALETVDVSGRVLDGDGRPIGGAAVESDHYFLPVGRGPYPHAPVNFWLSRTSTGGEGRRARVTELTAVTNEDGSFSIRDVPAMPGGLVLRVTCAGRAGLQVRYDPRQPLPALEMEAGAEVKVRFRLPAGVPAGGGRLVLQGRPDDAANTCGVKGIPAGAVGSVDRAEDTDEEGVCTFGELPPGCYSVHYARGPGDHWAMPVIELGPVGRGGRREIEAVAVEGSVLCGTVRHAETGSPLEHAWVRYEGPSYPGAGSSLQTAITDARGRFATRTALAPGPLDLLVTANVDGTRVGTRHRVVVTPGHRTELDLAVRINRHA